MTVVGDTTRWGDRVVRGTVRGNPTLLYEQRVRSVGAILRDSELIMPGPDTVIRARDRVIVVARAAVVKKVEKLFAVRLDYF